MTLMRYHRLLIRRQKRSVKEMQTIIATDLAELESAVKGEFNTKAVNSLLEKIYFSFDEILQCAKTDELI